MFNCKGATCGINFYIGQQKLENVKEYKYLGVTLTTTGNMMKAREHIYKKALRGLFKLKACLGNTNVNPGTSLRLFDQQIKPICLYGAEIWVCVDMTKKKKQGDSWIENLYEMYQVEKFNITFCKLIRSNLFFAR